MAPENPRTHALCQERNPMGRPRRNEPRDQQLNLSLTTSELERIRLRAEAVGMRPVHFGRALILDETRAPEKPVARQTTSATPLDKLIYSQLTRLGNNLNQMVRHLHQTGDPLPADLEPLLNDIRQIIARVTA
jgi:Bacterial mobilisation protein (MobC)